MGQMEEIIGNQMTNPPAIGPQAVLQQLGKAHAFMVDQAGVRYINEGEILCRVLPQGARPA
jgi:hypothetical protein